MYRFIMDRGHRYPYNVVVWNKLLPSKVRLFTWIFSLNRLKTKDRLVAQGWLADTNCPFCDDHESHDHLFLSCNFSKQIWVPCLSKIGIVSLPTSINHCLSICSDKSLHSSVRLLWGFSFPTVCWIIWKARNDFIFSNQSSTPHHIINKAVHFLLFWTGASSSKKASKLNKVIFSSGLPDIAESSADSNGLPIPHG
ncbi:uncharacterized protein LOC109825521 [Asparagus officinalis]|uniref:uncharacterized protein LOC109825521 n=1 Tax=Asparagus officinalis TaxID=4686 RepID=UPI00098E5635|nr:uncharacterized protein LOC109825521 [Asparagus officinalis]